MKCLMIILTSLLLVVAVSRGEERRSLAGVPARTGGERLDMAGFSATQSISAGDYVNFRLQVANPGTASGYVNAT